MEKCWDLVSRQERMGSSLNRERGLWVEALAILLYEDVASDAGKWADVGKGVCGHSLLRARYLLSIYWASGTRLPPSLASHGLCGITQECLEDLPDFKGQ